MGLDPDLKRIPVCIKGSSKVRVFEFCRAIIDATANIVCAFKPQIAYFSSLGQEGVLVDLISYIHKKYPNNLVILDAKRGDSANDA